MATGLKYRFYGVSFKSIRYALCSIFFEYEGMTEQEFNECLKYVVPMQHNWEQPIKPGDQDTWIQYWIDSDDRMTQDYKEDDPKKNMNSTKKLARLTVRFLGEDAELWAKLMHHTTKRKSLLSIWNYYCNAYPLEYITPIIPINVDYFGVGNTEVAFSITILLQYIETLDFNPVKGQNPPPLKYIALGKGVVTEPAR